MTNSCPREKRRNTYNEQIGHEQEKTPGKAGITSERFSRYEVVSDLIAQVFIER